MTVDTLRVGSDVNPLDHYDEALPLGTEVSATGRRNHWWRKTGEDQWSFRGDGTPYTVAQILTEGWSVRLRALPDGQQMVDAPRPTVEKVKWQFRMGAKSVMASHGYAGSRDVEAALTKMVGDLDLPLGPGVLLAADAEAPQGTVVYTGSPDNPASLRVTVRDRHEWKQVLGEGYATGQAMQVASVPGVTEPPEWVTRQGTDEDARAIIEFRAHVWKVGWALKRSQGWCSTYEHLMRGLGIDERAAVEAASLTGDMNIGQDVHPEGAIGLPDGALLFWRHHDDESQWAVYRRDRGITGNRAGTRRVFGTETRHANYQRRMQLVALPDTEPTSHALGWSVPQNMQRAVFEQLPPGTVFQWHGPLYVVCRDNTVALYDPTAAAIPANGTYARALFHGTSEAFVVVSVP